MLALNSKTYYGYAISQNEFEMRQNEILSNMALSLEEQKAEIEKLTKAQKRKFIAKGKF